MRIARPRLFQAARPIVFAAATIFAGEGCSLNVDVDDPAVMFKASGDNQSAPPNTQLSEPFVVVVTDQFGQALENVTVNWLILAGGGSLSESSNKTVAGGTSSVTYTTGSTSGTATIQAFVGDVSAVLFTVTIT